MLGSPSHITQSHRHSVGFDFYLCFFELQCSDLTLSFSQNRHFDMQLQRAGNHLNVLPSQIELGSSLASDWIIVSYLRVVRLASRNWRFVAAFDKK